MKMLEERMQQLNTPLSGRVLRKIVPIYESNNKEELYSKIGAGIVDLKDLDKVLKVNATSKILKVLDVFYQTKRRTRRATMPKIRNRTARKRRIGNGRRNRNSSWPNVANRFRETAW